MLNLKEALDQYEIVFGKKYIIYVPNNRSESDIINEINYCIASGTLRKEPKWDDDPSILY